TNKRSNRAQHQRRQRDRNHHFHQGKCRSTGITARRGKRRRCSNDVVHRFPSPAAYFQTVSATCRSSARTLPDSPFGSEVALAELIGHRTAICTRLASECSPASPFESPAASVVPSGLTSRTAIFK